MQRSLIAAAACLASVSASAIAADPGWRVVVSSASSSIAIPQLPALSHSHYVQSTALADAGTGLIGFKLRQSNGPDGLWAERGSILAPYAEVGAGGATGPGRGGAVLTGVTGDFGPGLADDSAYFGGEGNGLRSYIAPSVAGGFYFSSGGRSSSVSGAPSFFGLFHHADGHNQPILLENTEGTLGPHIEGYIFNTNIVPYNIKAAGKYGALQTVVSPIDDTSSQYPGLWRLTPEGGAEPVAISGDTGAYAPAPGRIWNGTFYKFAVFDNGDIVTLADTRQGSTTRVSLWRLRRGEAPIEILKPGDLVQVPTTSGVVDLPVTAIDAQYLIALPPLAGRDTWFSANGDVLLDVDIQGYAATTTLVRGLAAAPNLIFGGGFD